MTAQPYTREAFAAWLRTRPPDEPFCEHGVCPIAASPLDFDGRDRSPNYYAVGADERLTLRIDTFMHNEYANFRGHDWSPITPRDVLILIDQLEDDNANRN